MDFIKGLPKLEGRDCILVVVDQFSKFAHFINLTHPTRPKKWLGFFLDQVAKLHGVPNAITSDRDKIFTSLFW